MFGFHHSFSIHPIHWSYSLLQIIYHYYYFHRKYFSFLPCLMLLLPPMRVWIEWIEFYTFCSVDKRFIPIDVNGKFLLEIISFSSYPSIFPSSGKDEFDFINYVDSLMQQIELLVLVESSWLVITFWSSFCSWQINFIVHLMDLINISLLIDWI